MRRPLRQTDSSYASVIEQTESAGSLTIAGCLLVATLKKTTSDKYMQTTFLTLPSAKFRAYLRSDLRAS